MVSHVGHSQHPHGVDTATPTREMQERSPGVRSPRRVAPGPGWDVKAAAERVLPPPPRWPLRGPRHWTQVAVPCPAPRGHAMGPPSLILTPGQRSAQGRALHALWLLLHPNLTHTQNRGFNSHAPKH